MEKRTFLTLLDKYLAGKATPEEERLLEEYYRRLDERSDLELSPEEESAMQQLILKNVWAQIGGGPRVIPMKRSRSVIWYAAASIILALSVGAYFTLRNQKPVQQITQNQVHDIAPGSNKATLTLSDGSQIVLSGAKNGTIASQGPAVVNKTADGQLSYVTSGQDNARAASATLFNILSTKRAEQYALTLPDGSKVWLNAASSLKYPVAFNGRDRTVELTGEAYFEVVHKSAQPFRVKVKGETVEDIGTHFNINAYNDEPVLKTTLVEGAVQISAGAQTVRLIPGQAAIAKSDGKISVIAADTEGAIAWKSGYFNLNSENLASIMRKVSRWYDADVTFEDPKLQDQVFGGTLTASRFKNVSQLLSKLQLTGAIHYRIENKKIIITD
jgi:ferric-dicitrate binding protein FerR (iron transport regulator)